MAPSTVPSPDVIGNGVIARRVSVAKVQDHAGPAVEETTLDVERGPRGAADVTGRLGELIVMSVGEVPVKDQPDADTAIRQVGHGPPALVDLHAPVVVDTAASEVLSKCGPRHVEQNRLADLLVHANEQQGRTGGAVHEPGGGMGTTAH